MDFPFPPTIVEYDADGSPVRVVWYGRAGTIEQRFVDGVLVETLVSFRAGPRETGKRRAR